MTENADVAGETSPEAEPTAATVARDHLLYAIADESKRVTQSQPGNASAALAELARAYALTATGRGTQISGPVPREEAELWAKRIPVVIGYLVGATPNQTEASTAAHDELLYAIANEAKQVSKSQPGNASAALAGLARALAWATSASVDFEVEGPVRYTLDDHLV
ncbi:hypothetical protein [Nocardia colli]|uniref:hypothetical protein n=1 Tax=Nocardia colli TaxID=2545717 RepID=UPI0035DA2199